MQGEKIIFLCDIYGLQLSDKDFKWTGCLTKYLKKDQMIYQLF